MDTKPVKHDLVSYEVYYDHDGLSHIAIFDTYVAALHFNNKEGVNGQLVVHTQQPSCERELASPVRYFSKWYGVAREQLLDAHIQDYSDEEIKRAFQHSIGRQFWFDVVQEMRLNGEIS